MEKKLVEFKKNILLWYPFKENTTILNLENDFEEILKDFDANFSKVISYTQNSKTNNDDMFDYITIIGNDVIDFDEKLKFANSHLKENGKILVAINNKYGIRNWNNGKNLVQGFSKEELEKYFKENNLNYKFYYVFPNYEYTNFLYSEKYKITEEDITRNFSVYPEKSIVPINENEAYREFFKESVEKVNEFANSFFIELSKNEIDTDINYVTFSNYRKREYRTMTIIKDKEVIKKPADRNAIKHINKIAENLKELEKLPINIIEKFENQELKSKFIKEKRFDEILSETENENQFSDKFNILKNILDKNLKSFDEIDKLKLKECVKNYNKEKLKKLHFVEKAFIDLVPKNCFLIDGILNVFDQEWIEENIPVEYIYYRAILNTPVCIQRIGKEELLRKFGLLDYVDLFEELEKELRDKTFDYEAHDLFFRQYISLEKGNKQRQVFKDEAFSLQERVDKLEQENHSLNLELEDARGKLVDYANQLRVISNSGSWKLIQKIRKIIAFFNFKNGVSLLDRFYPIGTRRREKYDIKQAEKKEIKRIQEMREATDEETVKYWLELEKVYKKRREELENAVLKPDSDPYEFWCKANDPSFEELEKQKELSKGFTIQPKISILVPLYNTPVDFFRELLFTLYNQTYSNWELCLADGSPQKLTDIEKMCKDKRICYKFLGENKGISGNTNEALKLATGDYIALLDHDDLLTLNSLYEIVREINENPEVEFIYTDEDKIESIDKPRYDPHFKPDYAPDFLMSGNYICHFSVFKKELMDKLDGFRSDYDGAQDFDIILRATEYASPKNIKHISKILYHWRIHPGSTAGNSEAKLYAYEAGEKAVQDHLNRIGLKAIAKRDEKINGFYTVKYLLDGNPKVNILIINKNNVSYLKNCIESIIDKITYSNYEIDIIDNESEDLETLKYYKEIQKNKNIEIINITKEILKKEDCEEISNAELINYAVSKIDGEFIVELDRHEKIITKDWLEILLGIAQRKDVGIVGGKVYYNNGTIKNAGIVYGIGNYAVYLYRETYNGHRVRDKMICNMSCISSLCRIYKKSIFEEIHGMNENMKFELLSEVDFSLKVRDKGYLNIYTPQVEVQDYDIFNERERIEDEDSFEYKREIKELKENWKSEFEKGDPYHNKNFSPASSNCIVRIDKV